MVRAATSFGCIGHMTFGSLGLALFPSRPRSIAYSYHDLSVSCRFLSIYISLGFLDSQSDPLPFSKRLSDISLHKCRLVYRMAHGQSLHLAFYFEAASNRWVVLSATIPRLHLPSGSASLQRALNL